MGATEFVGYTADHAVARVVALVRDGLVVDRAVDGEVSILVNQTPFYAESGGQQGDAGTITGDRFSAQVSDATKALGKLFVHHARVSGEVRVGDEVRLVIDTARRAQIRANHSATHLLHAALRHRLGGHVAQKGSLVAPDRLRFDFAQPRALTAEDIAVVEAEVNRHIRENSPVATRLMTPDAAIAEGAMALFGEKYGDEVRVLSMGRGGDGSWSVELCGGTHVSALGDIGLFKIVGESAVASGVRRIEAITGEAARLYLSAREHALLDVAAAVKARPEDAPARVAALIEDRRRLERELADAKRALAGVAIGHASATLSGASGIVSASATQAFEQVGATNFIGQVIEGFEPKALRSLVDDRKKAMQSGVVVLAAVNDGRASIAVGVTDDLTARISAVTLVRAAAAAVGGEGGGGRPDMAQAGGPDGAKAVDAVAAVRAMLAELAVAA